MLPVKTNVLLAVMKRSKMAHGLPDSRIALQRTTYACMRNRDGKGWCWTKASCLASRYRCKFVSGYLAQLARPDRYCFLNGLSSKGLCEGTVPGLGEQPQE